MAELKVCVYRWEWAEDRFILESVPLSPADGESGDAPPEPSPPQVPPALGPTVVIVSESTRREEKEVLRRELSEATSGPVVVTSVDIRDVFTMPLQSGGE